MALSRRPQRWSSTDELEELRCIEYDLIEEVYLQSVESRGIYPGQDLLQIFAGPFELKFAETREDRACQRPWRRTPALGGRARLGVSKIMGKGLEAGQRRETVCHRLGWNVPGKGNTMQAKFDEVSGGRK